MNNGGDHIAGKDRPQWYRQEFCANLILDKPRGCQIPGQTVAVKVTVPFRRE